MTEHLTVAEVYRMQYRLIELFGGMHGVRDKGAVESAVFRPQIGHYSCEALAPRLEPCPSRKHYTSRDVRQPIPQNVEQRVRIRHAGGSL